MNFDINALSSFSPDYGFDFSGDTTGGLGSYANFDGLVDGSGANPFSTQLDAFQPTWGQRALNGIDSLGQTMSQNMPLVSAAAGAINMLGGLYQGNKQMSMYKKQMAQQADQWNRQYNTSVNNYNERLADRQRQRIAANPNAESVESYMAKYGAK